MNEPDLSDPDNPEWTSTDFARAKRADEVFGLDVAKELFLGLHCGLADKLRDQKDWARDVRLAA